MGKDGRMSTPTTKQSEKTVIALPPQEMGVAGAGTMPLVLAKLAALRETYLQELIAAREKVKKNFLR